jgi:hypothetical protein
LSILEDCGLRRLPAMGVQVRGGLETIFHMSSFRSGMFPSTLPPWSTDRRREGSWRILSPLGRIGCALIGSYELLMRQVRHVAARKTPLGLEEVPHTSPATDAAGSYASHANPANDDVGSYDIHMAPADPLAASNDAQTDSHEALIRNTDEVSPRDPGRSRPTRPASELQHDAWQWVIANRTRPVGLQPLRDDRVLCAGAEPPVPGVTPSTPTALQVVSRTCPRGPMRVRLRTHTAIIGPRRPR